MIHDHYEERLKQDLERRKAIYSKDKTWRNYDRMRIAEALLRSYRRRMIAGKLCQVNNVNAD